MGLQTGRNGPSFGGLPMKHLSLITLTFQNSALILLMHYSRIMPPVGDHRYFTSTAVFLNEVIKLIISLSVSFNELSTSLPSSTPVTVILGRLLSSAFAGDSWKLAVPAVLYTVQNSLQYVAVSNLDAATFQVTYQLKILSTALFSVAILRRSLSTRRWISLVLLMAGVAVVQLPSQTDSSLDNTKIYFPKSFAELYELGSQATSHIIGRSTNILRARDVASQHPEMNPSVGLIAVLIACLLSGLAGVYFEKVLKDSSSSVSLWTRNVQLSFYSLFPAFFIGVLFKDGEEIGRYGFFAGYNWVVWMAVAFQAIGGVIVALVVNYADNIAKNFATSISILISFVASVFLFDTPVTLTFVVGTCIVLYATYMYSSHDRFRPSPLRIASYENIAIGEGSPRRTNSNDDGLKLPYPFKAESSVTSRPATPTIERSPFRSPLDRKVSDKREE